MDTHSSSFVSPDRMRSNLRIIVSYLLFGVLWIFLSDKLLALLISDPATLTTFQTYKGWVFVFLSAVLIFFLLRNQLRVTQRIESHLRQNEQRFRSTLENMLEGVQIISNEWRYLYVNNAAARQGKSSRELLLGKTMMEAYPGIEHTELFSIMKRCLTEQIPHRMENHFTFPDGTSGWFELNIEPVPEGLLILSQDITDRKRSQQDLLRLQQAISNSHDAIFMTDRDGTITFVNPAFESLYGYTALEVIGKNPRILKSERNAPEFYDTFWRTVLRGQTFRAELVNRTKGGNFLEIETVVDPFFDQQNHLSGFIAIQRDITERKRAEMRIQHLTRLYSTLSQVNQTIVRVKNKNDLFQSICRTTVEHGKFGLAWIVLIDRETGNVTQAAVFGTAHDRLPFPSINFKESPFKDGLIGRAITTGEIVVTRDIQTDPTMQHWRDLALEANYHAAAAVPFRQNGEIVGFVKLYSTEIDFFEDDEQQSLLREMGMDISFALDGMERENHRQRAEDELKASEERFYTIFKKNPAWVSLTSLVTGKTVEVNEAWEQLTGYSRGEAIGRTVPELGLYTESVWNMIIDEVKSKGNIANQEILSQRKSGDPRTLLVSREIVTVSGEDHLLSMGVDITDRKQAEELRAAHMAEIQSITSNIPGVIFQLRQRPDGSYHFPYASNGGRAIFGLSMDEIKESANAAFAMIHRDDAEVVRAKLNQSAKSLSPWSATFRVNLPKGKVVWAEGVATPRPLDDGSTLWHGYINDITEKKRLEEQYLRAQRMESVGTLAGGIAHDLNNILAPLMLALQVLRRKVTNQQDEHLIEMLETQVQRGADLVKQVLAFARGTEAQRTPLQIRHLVEELKKFAHNTLPANISVETDLPKDLWAILGDPTQIHQVLLNLCVNARDAMPQGGTLNITAENILLDEQYARMNPDAKAGPYILLKVRDTGVGMPPEIQKKIFEPFFTTKELGKGTGLGLSTVYTIVREHGGHISVYSEIGRGTEFKIYLPATESTGTKQAREESKRSARGNGELILLVDDEAAVLEIAKISLEANGYKVATASDGTEAISLYAQYKKEIRLVITDMSMPFMDGPALIRALRKMEPSIIIIGATGLSDKRMLAEAKSMGMNAILTKPFTAERLLDTIAKVLK